MNANQARDEMGTTRKAFQESGARRAFVDWLDARREDVSRARCGQLGYHAAQLIDALGADLPALLVVGPEAVAERLDDRDRHDPRGADQHRSHKKRAARALYAWVHDLDSAATKAVMDGQRQGDAAPAAAPPAAWGPADTAERVTDARDNRMDEALVLAQPPVAYCFFEDSVSSQVALTVNYGETVPDVLAIGRDVLAQQNPATRRAIACELAEAFDGAVDLPGTAKTTLTAVCDQMILSVLEKRGVEIRDVPLQKG